MGTSGFECMQSLHVLDLCFGVQCVPHVDESVWHCAGSSPRKQLKRQPEHLSSAQFVPLEQNGYSQGKVSLLVEGKNEGTALHPSR